MAADLWDCLEALSPVPPSLSHDPTFPQPAALDGESQASILPLEVFLTLHLPFHGPLWTWQCWVGFGDFKNPFQVEEFHDSVGLGKGNTTWHFLRWWAWRGGEPKPWITGLELAQELLLLPTKGGWKEGALLLSVLLGL